MAKSETKDVSRKDITYTAVYDGKNKEETSLGELGPVPTIGVRHMQCVWLFLMFFTAFGMRVVLSVTIVAMTDPLASVNPDVPTYPIGSEKGAILSAFFWGYICTQVFAGYAANKFGAKWFLIIAMLVQSVFGILIPYIAATVGPNGVMAVRMIQGLSQGFLTPIVIHVLSQWVPHQERARLATMTFGSAPLGTVAAIPIAGIISASSYGWPWVFYLYGGAGLIWCVAFYFFGYNSPAEHPSIGKAEKFYIEESLGHTDGKPSHKVPWKSLFTSTPVWALLVTQCGWIFGFNILLSQIPSYMNSVMNFNIKDSGLLSALPYLTLYFYGLGLSFVSDYIINKGFVSRTVARKIFTNMGHVVPAIALICLAFTKPNEPNQAIILLIIAVGSSAAAMSGFNVNHMDLTPNHAGTLMGLCNGVSNIFAIWAPLMVQILVKNEKDPEQWKMVFFIAAATYVVTGLVFSIFGSAVTQPWNQDQDNDKEKENI